jgi:hypothetical protein
MFQLIDRGQTASHYVPVTFPIDDEAVMAENAGTSKSRIDSLEERQQERDIERRDAERARTQHLNQGMDTGTRDSVRHGVDWGSADRGRAVISQNREPDKTRMSRESETSSNKDRRDDEWAKRKSRVQKSKLKTV